MFCMNKENSSRPGLIGRIFLTSLVAVLMRNLWDLYSPSLESQGSRRLSVIGKRLDWHFAFGSEELLLEISPWLNDDQIYRTTFGPVEIAGKLVVDERLDIRDRISILSVLK